MTKKENKQKGDKGEDIAVKYLENKGYEIVERNYRCKEGEVDVIVRKDEDLVFVEVKVKTSNFFGSPEEMVDNKKLEKINNVIDCFLDEKEISDDYNIRIDVIAIEMDDQKKYFKIRHIENFN